MSKSLKIFLAVLALVSIAFSSAIIFNWNPFQKIKIALTSSPTLTQNGEDSQSSCIVLDEAYCSQGKLVYEDNAFIGLGFRVPEGTDIYAPFNGGLDSNENSLIYINQRFYSGLTFRDLTLTPSDSRGRDFLMVLGYNQPVKTKQVFTKGEAFAQAGSFTFDETYLGGYNLILTFRNLNSKTGEWVDNFDLLKQFFNYIEKQP